MMDHSLPTPPNEEHGRTHTSRKGGLSSSSKVSKSVHHRASKRASTHSHPSPPHDSHAMADGRHKRVWKACERCRMKKTKCDGEFPCKRCKDDGLVCTAGTRKKTEYKQLPKGYAEVLEHTQFALIATVHKLYAMVRNSQPWELGEPELNDRGQPIIHNIAAKLGCIRPNSDIDLPVHSVFPEDEAGLAELATQLEAQQHEREREGLSSASSRGGVAGGEGRSYNHTDRASSSELDHSDFEHDYRRSVFGGGNSTVTLSPASLTYNDFESTTSADGFTMPSPSVAMSSYPTSTAPWGSRPTSMDLTSHYMQQSSGGAAFMNMDLLNEGLLESSFGTIKQHVPSVHNSQVMLGMGDPMIYSGYEGESLRL